MQGLREWLTEHETGDLRLMCVGMGRRTRVRREGLVEWLLTHRLDDVRRGRYGRAS